MERYHIAEALSSRKISCLYFAPICSEGRARDHAPSPGTRAWPEQRSGIRNEIRDENAYFDDIDNVSLAKDLIAMASLILDVRKADFKPSKFYDRYEDTFIEVRRTYRYVMLSPDLLSSLLQWWRVKRPAPLQLHVQIFRAARCACFNRSPPRPREHVS
jgi:hypothetical protein